MPTLYLFINTPVDGVVASDILKYATKAVAKTITKPESYVMILVNGGVPISFGGTEEPTAYGELISIGGLDPSVNGKLSAIIAEILQTKPSFPLIVPAFTSGFTTFSAHSSDSMAQLFE